MRLNLQLIKAFQFLQQFKLDVCHKLDKEHIILDALSRLASSNIGPIELSYLELNAFYICNTTLIEIHLILIFQILAEYNSNPL